MDLYYDKENVISSDEYSDDDDDDEALMNDAIRAQDHFRTSSGNLNNQVIQNTKFEVDKKQKELSSLIRRNKISVIYKNKSIRWLNSKKQRERYKVFIQQNKEKQRIKNTNKNKKIKIESMPDRDSVSIEDSDNDSIANIQDEYQKQHFQISEKTIVNMKQIRPEIPEIGDAENDIQELVELSTQLKKGKMIPEKRGRSSSIELLHERNEVKPNQNENNDRVQSPQFYKSINDMYPKFDNFASNHIDAITNNTLSAMEKKMKSLLNEINTLAEILHTKEMEWNRLLHLKMVKEEIYSRLCHKKHKFQIKENYSNLATDSKFQDLKELELYLSETKPVSPDGSCSTITIQKLIERRANMNSEDLKREKNNTSRLHSLLVSRNMLNGKELSENISSLSNGKKTNLFSTSNNNELFNHPDKGAFTCNRGRQGEFRDVKSIIADFRQKNPEVSPRFGKRIKPNESNLQYHSFCIPIHERNAPSSQYLHPPGQLDVCSQPNSVKEVTISPIAAIKKLSYSNNTNSVKSVNNHFNIRLDDNCFKNNDGKLVKNIQYPLCQECKTNESRFVCAGCGNQWYCSKKCQISAWDKHSEQCTE